MMNFKFVPEKNERQPDSLPRQTKVTSLVQGTRFNKSLVILVLFITTTLGMSNLHAVERGIFTVKIISSGSLESPSLLQNNINKTTMTQWQPYTLTYTILLSHWACWERVNSWNEGNWGLHGCRKKRRLNRRGEKHDRKSSTKETETSLALGGGERETLGTRLNSFGCQNTASAIFAKLWAMVTQKFKEVITVFMPTSWPPNINFF